MKNKLGQTILATSVLFGISAAAISAASAQTERSARTASRAVAICEGFGQEYVNTRTQNAGISASSTGWVEIPSTRIAGGGSGGPSDFDLYTVTFSGETRLTGGGSIEIQAQVSISGGPFVGMYPNEPDTFHSGSPAQTHTMTWCREIAGTPTVRILMRRIGGTFGSAFVVDDYSMRVERSS